MGKHATKDRAGGIVDDEVPDRLLDTLKISSEVGERIRLYSIDGHRYLHLRARADGKGLVDELLGFNETASGKGKHRLRCARVKEFDWGLSELIDETNLRCEICLSTLDVSEHGASDVPAGVPVDAPPSITDALSQFDVRARQLDVGCVCVGRHD